MGIHLSIGKELGAEIGQESLDMSWADGYDLNNIDGLNINEIPLMKGEATFEHVRISNDRNLHEKESEDALRIIRMKNRGLSLIISHDLAVCQSFGKIRNKSDRHSKKNLLRVEVSLIDVYRNFLGAYGKLDSITNPTQIL